MTRPLRVLFVDDDAADVELEQVALRREFEVEGLRIETADEFTEALSAGGFEVILCDYSMPRFSGMQALSLWQAAGALVPFIFVTGRLSEEVAVECIKAGATDYVLKGNLARLPAAVDRAVREFAAARALRQAEAERARVMAAVEQAAEAVVITDAKRRILYVNPAFTQVTGYPAEEVLGRDIEIDRNQPEAAKYEEMWRVISSGGVWRGELTTRRRDGSEYDAEGTVAPVLDANGTIANYCLIHRDVSERVAAERHLRELYARLAETDRLKDEFLAAFSHELRTPLNIIMGYADILSEALRPQLSPELRQQFDGIVRSANQLARLLNETLDLARLRIDAMQPRFVPTDIGALVREATEAFAPLAAGKRLALHCAVSSGRFSVTTDPLRLRQILNNLIDNAVKFTNQGTVVVSARPEGQGAVIEVQDTGIGMAAADIPHMFEDFRQLDGSSTRRYGGCGLGLALTKRLLDLLGGSIEVDSEVGRGSCFRVHLLSAPPDAVRPVAGRG
jgi:PAS domain S-box-containing protein